MPALRQAASILILLACTQLTIAGIDAAAGHMPSTSELGNFGEGAESVMAEELAQRRKMQATTPLPEVPKEGVKHDRPPAWYGRFDPVYKRSYMAPAIAVNGCGGDRKCSGAIPGKSYPYEEYIMDPTTPKGQQVPVMKVWYPAHAWSAGSDFPGGTLLFVYPYKWHPSLDKENPLSRKMATLEYEVYFPPDFDFVKGGKLPGLSGGGDSNGRGCGGGVDPDKCFSARIMWRRSGAGEAYLYVPEYMQAPDFCTYYPVCSGENVVPCTSCGGFISGVSFGRGTFFFKRGAWNKVSLTVGLSSPNVTNGLVEVSFNDKVVIHYDKINYRQFPNIFIEGIEVSTWYGGSDTTWGPQKDQYVMFRNFKAWRTDPPAAPTPAGRSAEVLSLVADHEGQVEEKEEMKVAD